MAMNIKNQLTPYDTTGIRSTHVRIVTALAATFDWTILRQRGVLLVSPKSDVRVQLPDNADIRESLFSKALRQVVTNSDYEGSPYLGEDLIRTFKPDSSTKGKLIKEFGAVPKPPEPKPITEWRGDAATPVAFDPFAEEPQLPLSDAPPVRPHIVRDGSNDRYESETLGYIGDQLVCLLCHKPIAHTRAIGNHIRNAHQDYRPSDPKTIKAREAGERQKLSRQKQRLAEKRKALREEAKALKELEEAVTVTERLPEQTPKGRGTEEQLAAIINIVSPGVNKLLGEARQELELLREENDKLRALVDRQTADRKALLELLQ